MVQTMEQEGVVDPKYTWWCSSCQEVVPPDEVTYEETHIFCGAVVYWRKEFDSVVSVQFINSSKRLPDEIPCADDARWFLFIAGGDPYCGVYLGNGAFKDSVGRVREDVDAWVEWVEI